MPWGRVESLQPLMTNELLHVRDEKTSGTAGGTFTSGAWQVRTLNTSVTNTISGASLASNQVTLPAGTYWIKANAPALQVNEHRLKLYNATTSADVMLGTNEYSHSADSTVTHSHVTGLFTISSSTALEVRHYCATTKATNGFGPPLNFGTEHFAQAIIWKVA